MFTTGLSPARRTGCSFAVEVTEYPKAAHDDGKIENRYEDRCHGFPTVYEGLRELVVVGVSERDEGTVKGMRWQEYRLLVIRSNSEVKRRENNLNCDTSTPIIPCALTCSQSSILSMKRMRFLNNILFKTGDDRIVFPR